MILNKRAFSLVELLIVVLIIGVLTAIALPQYQRAVEKARLMQNIVTVRALYDALERYRLANGQYPPAKDNTPGVHDISYFNELLDINIHATNYVSYYPGMFIKQGIISAHWSPFIIGTSSKTALFLCNAHPTEKAYKKNKALCLSVCTDKQWRTWLHGEYCIL